MSDTAGPKDWKPGMPDRLIIAFAALIGAGAGYTVIGFYGFIDWIQRGAGWIGGAVDPGLTDLLPFLILPFGLWLARWVRRLTTPPPGGEMVPRLIRAAAIGCLSCL